MSGRPSFADALVRWQRTHGRHDLPWQASRDPYAIWVSEIMLQQTRVATVIDYYRRFMARFPTLPALADADLDEVLRHWSGLGYYGRARNLHRCARLLVTDHAGAFPQDPAALAALPGIGRSTAAAIAAFGWGVPAPILDGNVKRVFSRVFGIDGLPGEREVEARLWQVAVREMPAASIEAYTQGLMDLGATVCTRTKPRCDACPMSGRCVALATGRIATLPAPRPSRQVATRLAELVLVRSGGRVLVERRPPQGLWGGLLSLPEFLSPLAADPAQSATHAAGTAPPAGAVRPVHPPPEDVAPRVLEWLRTKHRLPVADVRPFAAIRHAFTHFRLQARVWLAETVDPASAAAEADASALWLPLADVRGAALARPIKSLLTSLDE